MTSRTNKLNSVGRYFKKEKQNQQFFYQKRSKLQDQKVFYGQGYSKNSFDRFFNKQNQLFSYQVRNKMPVLQVNYEQRHSRNFFGKKFKYQNQLFSYQRNGELPVQQVNYGQGQPKSKQNCHKIKKFSRKYNQQRGDVLQQQQKSKSNFTKTYHWSNQLSNQPKQSLTKATAPVSIPKKKSTDHNMPTTDEKIIRPRKMSPTNLNFDS